MSALCHDFNGHAALVDLRVHHVKIVNGRALRGDKRFIKRIVLLFVHRAVDVIVVALIVAGGCEAVLHIKAFTRDDRCGGIEKAERTAA